MDDLEKRISCLERIVADLAVRFSYIEDKLFDARDRINDLEGDSVIALSAYYRTHPEAVSDIRRAIELLGAKVNAKE
jgi:hypothetical protein